MSSNTYSAEIYPDPSLRRIVLVSGILLATIGIFLIALLPAGAGLRVVAATVWATAAARNLMLLRDAWAECHAYRFTPGDGVFIRGPDAAWRPATWISGGVLLRQIGWIRLRCSGGAVCGELLCGDCRTNPGWRRLHVIWRHVGA